jgi:hypothetical protein
MSFDTVEVAGSSPVVPTISFNHLAFLASSRQAPNGSISPPSSRNRLQAPVPSPTSPTSLRDNFRVADLRPGPCPSVSGVALSNCSHLPGDLWPRKIVWRGPPFAALVARSMPCDLGLV